MTSGARAPGEVLRHALHQRREAAVEADHHVALRSGACRLDRGQPLARQCQRLLAEHVLAGLERRHDERRVQVVARQHEHRVHVGVTDHLVRVGRRDTEAVELADAPRGGAPRRRDRDRVGSARALERRQQHRLPEATRTDEADPERRLLLGIGAQREARRRRGRVRLVGAVVEHDAEERLCSLRDQVVGRERRGRSSSDA